MISLPRSMALRLPEARPASMRRVASPMPSAVRIPSSDAWPNGDARCGRRSATVRATRRASAGRPASRSRRPRAMSATRW